MSPKKLRIFITKGYLAHKCGEILDKKNLFPISLILVFVASWFIGNISYLFSDLGRGKISHGFVSAGGDVEVFDISIYFLLLIFFILAVLALTLYIYNKYGKVAFEIIKIPSVIVGFVIFLGFMFLTVGTYSTEFVIIMAIVGVITFSLIADKRGWARLNIISASAILLIAIPIIYRLYNINAGTIILDEGGKRMSKIGESGKELVEGATGVGGENIGLIIIGLLLVIIAIIAVTPKIISLIRSGNKESEEQSSIEKDLSDSVDKAIKDLKKGKDTRSTIIRCYQKMCFILEDYGVIYDKYMTPREFEYNAIHNLNLSKDTIDDLTSIFEEARYSSHSLKKSQRKEALKNLKLLRKEIG